MILPSPFSKHEFHLNLIAAIVIAAQHTGKQTSHTQGIMGLHGAIKQYTTSPQFPIVKKAIKSTMKKHSGFGLFTYQDPNFNFSNVVDDLTKICVDNQLV
ncbi:hypothetical protein FRC03_003068 [Tulasnella sp. 419]|nr:hypothetical protein FRC03_003068 [Tulasnella sp. 419]